MASAIDTELVLYQAIWDILEGDTEWAAIVEPGNRVRLDEVVGDEEPTYSNHVDSDFPHARLRLISGDSELWEGNPTFATHSSEGPGDWTEKQTHVFRLVLTSQLLSFQESSTLGKLSRNAIRKSGPKLGGISFVTGIKLKWTLDRHDLEDDPDMARETTTIDITVTTETFGSDLKGT